MDAVIPADVMEHIREIAHRERSLEGVFTTRQVADELGVPSGKARDYVRDLVMSGRARPTRVNLTDAQALDLGYLGGTALRCYRWID